MFDNNTSINIFLILVNIILFIACLVISILYLLKLRKLKKTSQCLEEANLHNQTLQTLYDSVRTFKHDFFNIMQSIDGYIKTDNKDCLKNFYNEIKLECNNLNSLSALNPELVGDTAIYNLIASKYLKAQNLNISFTMQFMIKFSSLNINSYKISRILGVLLDNAIEAASNSQDKKIIFEIMPIPCFDTSKQAVSIVIENSYSNKEIDLSRICEKGFTSKPQSSRFSWAWSLECFEDYRKM